MTRAAPAMPTIHLKIITGLGPVRDSGARRSDSVQGPGRGVPEGPAHHVGQREGVEVLAHVLADFGPDGQEDALAFVFTGAVLVGTAEIAGHDGPVDGVDDL